MTRAEKGQTPGSGGGCRRGRGCARRRVAPSDARARRIVRERRERTRHDTIVVSLARRCMLARALAGHARGVVRRACASGAREGGSTRRRAIATTAMSGRFADVPEAPKDPILGISEMFVADSHPEKMNLGVVRVERFRRRGRGGARGTGRRDDARVTRGVSP